MRMEVMESHEKVMEIDGYSRVGTLLKSGDPTQEWEPYSRVGTLLKSGDPV